MAEELTEGWARLDIQNRKKLYETAAKSKDSALSMPLLRQVIRIPFLEKGPEKSELFGAVWIPEIEQNAVMGVRLEKEPSYHKAGNQPEFWAPAYVNYSILSVTPVDSTNSSLRRTDLQLTFEVLISQEEKYEALRRALMNIQTFSDSRKFTAFALKEWDSCQIAGVVYLRGELEGVIVDALQELEQKESQKVLVDYKKIIKLYEGLYERCIRIYSGFCHVRDSFNCMDWLWKKSN